ncbi:OST-HTH/LOTUS domain-containing protein [Sinorhizobium meliloti]|uniref:OST-HTH/LOTUS domain-containing protein n=1 Tax=Rhizobium meliloti TaxID=382 RepID=UPI00307E2986
MSGQADDRVVIGRLNEIRTRRPPWQLLMVGNTDGMIAFSAETNNALMRIFDLLPHLGGVTIKTTSGDLSLSCDFPGNYVNEVDELLAAFSIANPKSPASCFPRPARVPNIWPQSRIHICYRKQKRQSPQNEQSASRSPQQKPPRRSPSQVPAKRRSIELPSTCSPRPSSPRPTRTRANLARVGAHLAKQSPDFDARNYGFARLSDLVAASGLVDMESTGDHP